MLPVENQVRELDSKILLACVAGERGFTSYIGSRREMHFNIRAFPRGVYLSKSMTRASDMMFKIMRLLGHAIVAWDEEALVHLPRETYYSRRLSPAAMAHVSHLFAWGEENANLWQRYPQLPPGCVIDVTGNPRNDLLRPELHAYYEGEVQKIRRTYGDYILVNTNFNHVNAFSPVQNLFQPVASPGEVPKFGRAAKGMSREYAEGLRDHKQAVFEDFQAMIPFLHDAFTEHAVIVRPHPTENPDVYHRLAGRHRRITVTNEGNVVPWLLGAKALIHNGCTTGVEAYAMRIPAITYRASVDDTYDFGFYRLPNLLSHQCLDLDELKTTLGDILTGALGPADGIEREQLVAQYLAALNGPLACERIVEAVEKMGEEGRAAPPGVGKLLRGQALWALRTMVKRYKDARPGSHNKPEFQRHRYPPVSLDDIRERVARFQVILENDRELKTEQVFDQFLKISPS
jgi:surface carbohydrate biosynthesis protein